ncbi:hypothetical protein [Spirosoma lituiforme]
MTVIISNQRVTVRSFSINKHPVSIVSPTYRHWSKALSQSMARPRFLADEANDTTLNPYSRAFFLLWLAASLIAVGVHYM